MQAPIRVLLIAYLLLLWYIFNLIFKRLNNKELTKILSIFRLAKVGDILTIGDTMSFNILEITEDTVTVGNYYSKKELKYEDLIGLKIKISKEERKNDFE